VVSVSIALSIDELSRLLGELARGLAARPFTCPGLTWLQTAVDQSASLLAQNLPPMLRGLRGIAMVLDDASTNPPGGAGQVVVVGDRIPALVTWLLQLPVFAGTASPALGIPVALPVQQLGLPSVTSAHLAQTSDRLAIAVGPNSDRTVRGALSLPNPPRSPLFSMTYDIARLHALLPTLDDTGTMGSAAVATFDIDVNERGLSMEVDGVWEASSTAR
jgi:hypothetical protein